MNIFASYVVMFKSSTSVEALFESSFFYTVLKLPGADKVISSKQHVNSMFIYFKFD